MILDRRSLIAGIGAVNLLAVTGCSRQQTAAHTADVTGEVVRVDADTVRVSWSGLSGAVTLKSGTGGDMAGKRDVLQQNASSPVELPGSKTPRPYFVLEDSKGARLMLAERILPLEGGRNFRDLGGYHTEDGRQVQWGRLYRSGVMAELTDNDLAYLASLGISRVCDLRSSGEIDGEPSRLVGAEGVETVTFAYDMDVGSSIGPILQADSREAAVEAFAGAYLGMGDMLVPHFTDLFARLARGEAPLAMNCSAGKDRTGMASALILTALGVPRQTVIADYALSETVVPPEKYLEAIRNPQSSDGPSVMPPEQAALFARVPDAALRVLFGTDPDVMRLTLDRMDKDYGGPLAYARSKFALTDEAVTAIRRNFLV